MLRRGFLHWSLLDKRRPALVISPDHRNELASDVIVIPASTRLRFAPTHVFLRKGEGGMSHPSVLHAEGITTIPKSDVDPTALGARLGAGRIAEVERAILIAVGILVE